MIEKATPRWGFLGTGWIADVLAADLALEGIRPRAVASRRFSTAEAFAKPRGIDLAFGSYSELCESPEVDVVYVATPHPWHLENARLALQHGKHVLVEKPFSMNASEARELIELARAQGLFLMEAMWSRFLPAQLALVEAMRSGEIGAPLAVVAEHSQNLPESTHARLWERELGGGALLDLGVYPLALIHNLLGKPSTVNALGALAHTGVDDLVQVGMGFDGGQVASLFTTQQVAGAANATVYGKGGRIDVRGPLWGQFEFDVLDVNGEVKRQYHESVRGTGRQLQVLAMNDAISNGLTEHPLMPLAHTLEIAMVMDEIRSQLGVVYPADEVA